MNDTPNLPLLIECTQTPDPGNLPGVLLVDVCRDETYAQIHLPGAVHVSPAELVSGELPASGKLPPAERISQTLARIGWTPDQHVIAYDDEGGGWAGRLLWTLEMLGHQQYSYLDGGLRAWLDAGLPVTNVTANPAPSTLTLSWQDGPAVDLDYLRTHTVGDNLSIWDARSPEEFDGSRMAARKSGHIPGAVNYEWTRAMDSERSLRVRDLAAVRAELAALGIEGHKTIVTHCQTHHRSGFTWLVGRLLAFPDIRAYPGSWSEWGNHPDTPVETGSA